MTKLLLKLFVRGDEDAPGTRGRYGLVSSMVGILCNAVLCACKFVIGSISGSVSIMADSVNNLSDAGSSVVTMIGFKVSGKPADEDHPFGHARAEYIGGLVVAFMILLLGVTFFKTSVDKILNPEALEISVASLVVLALSILVKVWMCSFNRYVGRKIASAALLATAQDSLNDVITTSMVLVATIVSKYTGLLLDGWMGLVVAVFILFSGIGIARETVSPLLGQRPPEDLVDTLEAKVGAYPGILGMHDLMAHSYGPDQWFASLHAEVDAREDILKSHDLIDNIERDVLADLGVHLVIHLDPIVTGDPVVDELRGMVKDCVKTLDESLSMHDFRLVRGETHSNLIFDISVPTGCRLSDKEIAKSIERMVQRYDEHFYTVITIDRSYVSSNTAKPK